MTYRYLKRFVLFLFLLVICAGAAWLVSNRKHEPVDAVLAYHSMQKPVKQIQKETALRPGLKPEKRDESDRGQRKGAA